MPTRRLVDRERWEAGTRTPPSRGANSAASDSLRRRAVARSRTRIASLLLAKQLLSPQLDLDLSGEQESALELAAGLKCSGLQQCRSDHHAGLTEHKLAAHPRGNFRWDRPLSTG